MPFVKLDCGILNSTLWFERESRELFITALLMAEPHELLDSTPQLQVRALTETGWMVPSGWYGFVAAAGVGIIDRAKVEQELGLLALEKLGSPEVGSRSRDFDGRRLVRIDGGYLVLNYMKYRERDYTSAERSKRYRKRLASRRDTTPTHRDITQAEAEAEVDQVQDQEQSAKSADSVRLRLRPTRNKKALYLLACDVTVKYPELEWVSELKERAGRAGILFNSSDITAALNSAANTSTL